MTWGMIQSDREIILPLESWQRADLWEEIRFFRDLNWGALGSWGLPLGWLRCNGVIAPWITSSHYRAARMANPPPTPKLSRMGSHAAKKGLMDPRTPRALKTKARR